MMPKHLPHNIRSSRNDNDNMHAELRITGARQEKPRRPMKPTWMAMAYADEGAVIDGRTNDSIMMTRVRKRLEK